MDSEVRDRLNVIDAKLSIIINRLNQNHAYTKETDQKRFFEIGKAQGKPLEQLIDEWNEILATQ